MPPLHSLIFLFWSTSLPVSLASRRSHGCGELLPVQPAMLVRSWQSSCVLYVLVFRCLIYPALQYMHFYHLIYTHGHFPLSLFSCETGAGPLLCLAACPHKPVICNSVVSSLHCIMLCIVLEMSACAIDECFLRIRIPTLYTLTTVMASLKLITWNGRGLRAKRLAILSRLKSMQADVSITSQGRCR